MVERVKREFDEALKEEPGATYYEKRPSDVHVEQHHVDFVVDSHLEPEDFQKRIAEQVGRALAFYSIDKKGRRNFADFHGDAYFDPGFKEPVVRITVMAW